MKKASIWIWLVVILLIIAVGIVLYFWLINGGNSIPTPPALP